METISLSPVLTLSQALSSKISQTKQKQILTVSISEFIKALQEDLCFIEKDSVYVIKSYI